MPSDEGDASTGLPSARVMPRKVISGPIGSPGFPPGLVWAGGRGVGKAVDSGGGTVGTGVGVTTSRGGGVTPAIVVFFAVGVHPEITRATPSPAMQAAEPAT